MSAPAEGSGVPGPARDVSSDDKPTHQARVAIEKADFRMEVAAAPRQLVSILRMIVCVLVVFGAVFGPALTLAATPGGIPVWVTFTTIIGQLAVLALVAPYRVSPLDGR